MRAVLAGAVLLFAPLFAFAQVGEVSSDFAQFDERIAEIEDRLGTIGEGIEAYTPAETREFRARVVEIVREFEVNGERQLEFVVEENGAFYTIDTSLALIEGVRYNLRVGDRVLIQTVTSNGTLDAVYLIDVVRTKALLFILALFFITILATGGVRGLKAVGGLVVTGIVLFGFMYPMILRGNDPVVIAVLSAVAILLVNMHLSHGFNLRTLRAFASTVIGAFLVLVFAKLFTGIADLTGLANEEAVMLYFSSDVIVPKGILLAGILIGAVGVLDDIAVAQTEAIEELAEANPKLTKKELFTRGMRLGQHHIASTINTLVLAYAGVATPLLLLFLMTDAITFSRFINEEPIVEEIVRTLAGTMGLLLTVPIATWFATFGYKR